MRKKLSSDGFEWNKIYNFTEEFVKTYKHIGTGYIVEVDMKYSYQVWS